MASRRPAPLLGAHVSIAGGLHLALERGEELGCTSIQIFTKNATQWRERAISPEEAALFAGAPARAAIRPVLSHAGYLINLASPDGALREKSSAALTREVERCRLLGIPAVVLHPGSHGGDGEEAGLRSVAEGLKSVVAATPTTPVRILLETTAGQGNALGWRFEQLAFLLAEGGPPERLGVCFDTAHAFAAGYDLRTPAAWRATMKELDAVVGLERVAVIHVNDSRNLLGSRVDRHEHIGSGRIGLEGFRAVMRDERFVAVPKILEAPKYRGKEFMDPVNLAVLRDLAGAR